MVRGTVSTASRANSSVKEDRRGKGQQQLGKCEVRRDDCARGACFSAFRRANTGLANATLLALRQEFWRQTFGPIELYQPLYGDPNTRKMRIESCFRRQVFHRGIAADLPAL